MTTRILTTGKIMAKEDLDKRIMATRCQAKEECNLALKRIAKLCEDIKRKALPILIPNRTYLNTITV